MEEKFGSKTAFIMASVGSAVGIGNIFRFPALCSKYGAIFILAYFLLLFLLGMPLLFGELALGRRFGKNPVFALKSSAKFGLTLGLLTLLNCFLVMSYYTVLFSFIAKRAAALVLSPYKTAPLAENNFNFLSVLFLFICFCLVLVCFGSAERLGRVSVIGMFITLSVLILLALLCAAKNPSALTLFCSFRLKFLLSAPFWVDLLGQVFFSLSLSVGVMVCYGAFLPKEESITLLGLTVALFDFFVSLLASIIFVALNPKTANVSEGLLSYSSAFSVFGSAYPFLELVFYLSVAFLCLDSVVSYLKAVVLGLSFKILGKQRHIALFVTAFSAVFALFLLFFSFIDLFDQKIVPALSLIIGFFESIIFSSLLKRGNLEKELFLKPHPKITAFLTLCFSLLIPLFLGFLFLTKILN